MSPPPDVRLLDPPLLAAVAAGGVAGAEGRYALGRALPHAAGAVPWATLAINLGGCLLIGVLGVLLAAAAHPPRLARPFLATGVLGGWTTFSAFSVDAVALLRAGHPAPAVGYVLGTAVGAVLATAAGAAAARAAVRASPRGTSGDTAGVTARGRRR